MFSKLNLYIVALCAFLMTVPIEAQSIRDSTDLPKMQESDFKAIESEKSVVVLTKGNMKQTFKGMKVTVDNSGAYSGYKEDLLYTVVERSGNLAIQKYTPRATCTAMGHSKFKTLCFADDKQFGGRTSIMCVIPQGAKSCTGYKDSYYELTLSGLLMGESFASCWHEWVPMVNLQTRCGHKTMSRKVYIWDAPVVAR